MKIFPHDLFFSFEFDKVLIEIEKRCESILGIARVGKVRPMDQLEEVKKLLVQTKEMTQVLLFEEKFPEYPIADIQEIVKFLQIENYVLNELQFVAIRKVAYLANEFIIFFNQRKEKYPSLYLFISTFILEKRIKDKIDAILTEDGKLKSNASADLVRIRKQMDGKTRELEKAFAQTASRLKKAGVLSEVEESIRNGRRVFGILSEYKRQVKGTIHDESDTGKTTFIEPEEIVQIHNALFEFEREEKREIYRILKNLTSEIAIYQPTLERYQLLLGVIDFKKAKAKYAIDIEADIPIVEAKPGIHLYQAKHPILFLLHKDQKKDVVHLDIELNESQKLVVISGPNAGGKSVAMKTVGLIQLMAQSGILIPANNKSRVGVFKNIFCDVGDAQSLADELSTYSSRLFKMQEFLKYADKQTIIFIDEFGSGTDPAVGGAIAEASLHALVEKNIYGVITTHYSNLKVYASNHKYVINGSMLFDEQALKPTYQFEAGKPGSSYAFEIATKTKIPENIIHQAKELVSKEHIRFEELLKRVRIEREYLKLKEKEIKKREEELHKKELNVKEVLLQSKEKERQYNLKKLEKEDDFLRKLESEYKKLVDVWNQSQPHEKNASKEVLKNFISVHRSKNNKERRNQFIKSEPLILNQNIKVGGLVKLVSGDEIGIVESIQNNKAIVLFKHMRTSVLAEELVGVQIENFSHQEKQKIQLKLSDETLNHEIDLRGKSKDEAMQELEIFLDKAMLRNVYQLRILHGKGTGVLRDAVQYVLKNYPNVKKYQFEENNLGGDGVTLVEF